MVTYWGMQMKHEMLGGARYAARCGDLVSEVIHNESALHKVGEASAARHWREIVI